MFIADFHIHSSYSRATSKECRPEYLDLWARRKGIGLIGTGDFTHPAWRQELKEKLIPAEEGLFALKEEFRISETMAGREEKPRFVLSAEISSIYKKDGKVRKVHNVILLPSMEKAEGLSKRLEEIGNLHSDGRPILGLDCRDLLEITLNCCPEAIFIPAHIWTPHFSLFGAFSQFSTIEECFGDMTPYIHALETGLSSDPPMNWRLSALDRFALVSNSDAHSPSKLGREANVFNTELSYPAVAEALRDRQSKGFAGTIEFFPEEGKYHLDGHRSCSLCLQPAETQAAQGRCPVCGKKITVGVLSRVEQLADRPEGFVLPGARPFESLIPLTEVIAASTGQSAAGVRVKARYEAMLRDLGPEFFILRELPLDEIGSYAGACVAEGIRRMRCAEVEIQPGYDGEYGKIHLLDENEIDVFSGQICFFEEQLPKKKKTKTKAAKSSEPLQESTEKVDTSGPAVSEKEGQELAGLNEEQRAAVMAQEKVLAVIAGPGTGKTKTLISRIAYLIEKGISPSAITAVTFTNKAAAEMRQRLKQGLGKKKSQKGITIGTFHSICLHFLKSLNKTVTLLDEYEALSIAEEVLRVCGEKMPPRKFLQELSGFKNGLMQGGEGVLPQAAFQLYCTRLMEYGVLDFDDLLLETLKYFEHEKEGLPAGENPFCHILIDELQDINPLQYRLIKAWGQNSQSIFVIGDPDQSIYGFRGSDSRCFERFASDFPGMRVIRLLRNYRSTPMILNGALALIANNPSAAGERVLHAMRQEDELIRLITAQDDFAEAVFIAKEINRLVGGVDMLDVQNQREEARVRGFSDIAVLYRTHRQAMMLEKCLAKEGIPYVVSGKESLLANKAVRGVTAFFRFLLNPCDIISMRTYCRQILACSEALIGFLSKNLENQSARALTQEGLFFPSGGEEDNIAAQKWEAQRKRYLPLVLTEKPVDLITAFAVENELLGIPEIDHLLNIAVFSPDMPSFLENLSLGKEADVSRSANRSYTSDAVSLMTLHGSKGLEFPLVFLCGVNKGTLPLDMPGRGAELEEERRLFYVGMTRARDQLILLTSSEPSAFVSELPAAALLQEKAQRSTTRDRVEQLSFF